LDTELTIVAHSALPIVPEPSITMHNWTLTEDDAAHGGTSVAANAKTNVNKHSKRTALDFEAFPFILVAPLL
jgi:hypothetical protein